jgi:hypothetical protein
MKMIRLERRAAGRFHLSADGAFSGKKELPF